MALTFIHGRNLVIVLDEENLERVQHNNPFELDLKKMGTVTLPLPFRVVICYARKDDKKIYELAEKGEMDELMSYLSRGLKITASDHDRPYDRYDRKKRGN